MLSTTIFKCRTVSFTKSSPWEFVLTIQFAPVAKDSDSTAKAAIPTEPVGARQQRGSVPAARKREQIQVLEGARRSSKPAMSGVAGAGPAESS